METVVAFSLGDKHSIGPFGTARSLLRNLYTRGQLFTKAKLALSGYIAGYLYFMLNNQK